MSSPSDTHNTALGNLGGERDEPGDRPAGQVDFPRIERAVREILAAVGEDPRVRCAKPAAGFNL